MCCCFIFFFKQKTAYEMRISDWSSDVRSSDLGRQRVAALDMLARRNEAAADVSEALAGDLVGRLHDACEQGLGGGGAGGLNDGSGIVIRLGGRLRGEHGRASCRARVCQYG